MNLLGKKTKTIILHKEADKTALEFEVNTGVEIQVGQPVKLTTDGKVTPWAKSDKKAKLLGYAYNHGTAGKLVTVIVVGFMLINAISGSGGTSAGPVAYQSYDTTTDLGENAKGYSVYDNVNSDGSENDQVNGYATINAAGAGELIQVVLF